jgi:hypothetical protein
MNASFIVTLDVESQDIIPDTAIDLEDDLLAAGHDVIVVKPWARPTIGLTPELPPLGGGLAPPPEPPPSLF